MEVFKHGSNLSEYPPTCIKFRFKLTRASASAAESHIRSTDKIRERVFPALLDGSDAWLPFP